MNKKVERIRTEGWIEVSFDTLCINHVVNTDNYNRIMSIVNHHYGYNYDKNVFPIMCSVLGIDNWENVLDSFPAAALLIMKAILNNYKTERDRATHNNTIPGVTQAYWAPSTVIMDYNKMKPAFQYLEGSIGALK